MLAIIRKLTSVSAIANNLLIIKGDRMKIKSKSVLIYIYIFNVLIYVLVN